MSLNVESVSESLKQFGFVDYGVFGFMLIVCSCVGLYFGYKDHRQVKERKVNNEQGSASHEYLLGGQNVQVFPGLLSFE